MQARKVAKSGPRVAANDARGGKLGILFSEIANRTSSAAGSPATFVLASLTIIVWAVTGPIFGFSDTWQLVINTGTTIITFLMVFLIQNSQNRDGKALQAKLDELILTSKRAENKFIGIEKLDEKELRELKQIIDEKARTTAQEGKELDSDLEAAQEKIAEAHAQKQAAE